MLYLQAEVGTQKLVHFRNELTDQNGNQFTFFLFQSNILTYQRWQFKGIQ